MNKKKNKEADCKNIFNQEGKKASNQIARLYLTRRPRKQANKLQEFVQLRK